MSMTTVWSYGTVDSTFSVPSANQVSIRRNAMFLSAFLMVSTMASTTSRSSASVGLATHAGPCIERR